MHAICNIINTYLESNKSYFSICTGVYMHVFNIGVITVH